MSIELDLCYVEASGLIHEAVTHVLNQSSCDERLKEELLQWQSGGGGRKKQQEEAEYCLEESSIPFELVFKVHQQLKTNPLG